jgi:hypothetical protein
MTANPKQVMRILGYRGIHVRLVDGKLIGRSLAGSMPSDMVRFIKHFKDVITAELAERERLAETVDTILQLTPEDLTQYRQEIAEAPADDPWIDHDRRALCVAEARMSEGNEAA